MTKIPKIIHYCWMGGAPKPASVLRCIESWKRFCPDYEIREWNESNYDPAKNAYTQQAYAAKKWAFVTDYARLDIVYEHGGIYLDTDVEVVRSFDGLLDNECFLGFEAPGERVPSVNSGHGFGAVPGSEVVRRMREEYDGVAFLAPDGSMDLRASPSYNTQALCALGLVREDRDQRLPGVTVYASDVLCPLEFHSGRLHRTERTVSIHHYGASWHKAEERRERRITLWCRRLFGQTWGAKLANAVNFAMRRDGSFGAGVRWNAVQAAGKLFRLLPVRDTVAVAAEDGPSGAARELYAYMLERGSDEKRRVVWLVPEPDATRERAGENVRLVSKDSLAGAYHAATARTVLWTGPSGAPSCRKGQRAVALAEALRESGGCRQTAERLGLCGRGGERNA